MGSKRRGAELAERFRLGIDLAAQAEQTRREAQQQRTERVVKEQKRLMEDLFAFGEALGHFQCKKGPKKKVTWIYGARQLTFEPVSVSGSTASDHPIVRVVSGPLSGEDWNLCWQHELGRWVLADLSKKVLTTSRQLLLYNEGLEWLMAKVFDIHPVPEGELVEAPKPITLDDAIPR